jgi:urease beta subunit
VLLPVLMLALLLGSCTSSSPPKDRPRAAPPAPLRLHASVAQFRFDEGTRNLRAGVSNLGDRAVRVSSATISWDGFAFPTVPIPDPQADAQPGQSVAFTIKYGAARCGVPPHGRPVMVAVVDGHARRLPLEVQDPQLLVRLHQKACAGQRLAAVADVGLRIGRREVVADGERYLAATLHVRRHPGATGRVTLVDLSGSVLIELRTREKNLLPVSTADPQLRGGTLPLLIGAPHRCDAHARSQSSQTFLLSAYVRLDHDPVQRVVMIPTIPEQTRVLALIDRVCGPISQ